MIPAYRHSASSSSSSSMIMSLDLNNEDQNHQQLLITTTNSSSSSLSSDPAPTFINSPNQDQQGSQYYCWELPNHLPTHEDQGEKSTAVISSGSWDHHESRSSTGMKLTVWRKKDENDLEASSEDGSVKWMSSKMRILRKMMSDSDHQTSSHMNNKFKFQKQQQQQQPAAVESPLVTSENNINNNSNVVRVCSDCHTTKTPLWRSGPRGPKSLCNACGIRQRKARRAMAAAAASANGTVVPVASDDQSTYMKGKKFLKKDKKSKINECTAPQLKKKKKKRKFNFVVGEKQPSDQHRQLVREKFGFEDLTLRLSKNLANFQQVFPQDEKEGAILLMALSYGLVNG